MSNFIALPSGRVVNTANVTQIYPHAIRASQPDGSIRTAYGVRVDFIGGSSTFVQGADATHLQLLCALVENEPVSCLEHTTMSMI